MIYLENNALAKLQMKIQQKQDESQKNIVGRQQQSKRVDRINGKRRGLAPTEMCQKKRERSSINMSMFYLFV